MIINWSINSQSIEFDHEIIRFEIITNINNLINRAITITNQYNIEKTDSKNYEIYLKKIENDVKTEMIFCYKQTNFEKTVNTLQNFM